MTTAAFAFGKLPAHGDFVARGLQPGEREAWDLWASHGLQLARAELQADFEAAHEAAPVWRFAFGPGAFGAGWRAGAIAPSIDSAGRRFLIIAGLSSPDPLPRDGSGGPIAERLESALYQALATNMDIDALRDTAQDAQAQLSGAPHEGRGCFWTLGGPNHPPSEIAADQPPEDLVFRMLAAMGAHDEPS